MGTWISHLRIAEAVLARIPDLDPVAFTYGNLAPDSGIPNADWSAFDPPKEVTHFLVPGEGEGRIRDMAFFTGYLAPQAATDRAHYSFLLGYFCHLLSDNLWSRRVAATSQQAYPALFAADRGAAWETIKTDWYGLDQRYVRDTPTSSFWQIIMRTPNPSQHVPFIPLAGLHYQLDYIRTFYSQPGPEWVLDRAFPYLGEATMARYVCETAEDLCAIIARLGELPGLAAPTALALLPPARLAAYPSPLGDSG